MAIAVAASTRASPRVARTSARRFDTSTIWITVASSTPASAASGMCPTQGAATSMTISRATAWVDDASRDRAPLRTLTAVRAMAAVAGTPPKIGTTRFATPWPKSSRSESCRSPTDMPSATVAESRLSSAASAATAMAGTTSALSCDQAKSGRAGAGNPVGMAPMVSASSER